MSQTDRLCRFQEISLTLYQNHKGMTSFLYKIELFVNELDEEIIHALQNISKDKTYKKGDILLREGNICQKSILIKDGIIRKFYNNDGKEIITELLFKDDLAVAFSSYVMQQPSREQIQALSDTHVLETDYFAFQDLKSKYTVLEKLDLMLTELYALWMEQRMLSIRTLSATDRYKLLIEKESHILKYVSLTDIASYLGISLETLSRIRARM